MNFSDGNFFEAWSFRTFPICESTDRSLTFPKFEKIHKIVRLLKGNLSSKAFWFSLSIVKEGTFDLITTKQSLVVQLL